MSTPDTTPPFTEAVPNPPTGPEAEERLDKNVEAAEQRGAPDEAEAYQEQTDTASQPDADNQSQPAGTSDLTPDDSAGEARPA